jgi:hypothetical protein
MTDCAKIEQALKLQNTQPDSTALPHTELVTDLLKLSSSLIGCTKVGVCIFDNAN